MIKAETITHEGNPGPNWLDHCRMIITPWTATIAIVVVALAGLVWATQYHSSPVQPGASSQAATPPAANSGLQVAPLQDTTQAVAPSPASLIQSSNGAADVAPTTAAARLGAPQTPALNTAGNGGGVLNQLQNALTKSGLLNGLQTIIPGNERYLHVQHHLVPTARQ